MASGGLDLLRKVGVVVASATLGRALEWVAPASCAACDGHVEARRVFCAPCAGTVVRLAATPSEGADARAPFAYGGALAEAIRRFKYGRRPDLARPLGHLLRASVVDAVGAFDQVVPVPLHPRRRADRGFDQAALLAVHVARQLGCPLRPEALRRTRHGPAQASLGRGERLQSAALAFEAATDRVAGSRVLLVDDVVTTGATLRACSAALYAAGAARVEALTLARAEA